MAEHWGEAQQDHPNEGCVHQAGQPCTATASLRRRLQPENAKNESHVLRAGRERCASTCITCIEAGVIIAARPGVCVNDFLIFVDCLHVWCDLRYVVQLAMRCVCQTLPFPQEMGLLYLFWHQRCSAQQIVQMSRLTGMHRMLLQPDLTRPALQSAHHAC